MSRGEKTVGTAAIVERPLDGEIVIGATLADCAVQLTEELAHVTRLRGDLIAHAVRCGQILLASHKMVPAAEWRAWVRAECPLALKTVYGYMRLARHADVALNGKATTIDGALALVSVERPWTARRVLTAENKAAMVRMAQDDGMNLTQIAETFGVSTTTVWYWISPKNRNGHGTARKRRTARQQRAERALLRQESESAAKRAGGGMADGYSLLRRALQALDRAEAEAGDRDTRMAINRAIGRLHAGEDELVRALGLAHRLPNRREKSR